MTPVSIAALAKQIQALLPPTPLADFSRLAASCANSGALPEEMLEETRRLGWLTDFQSAALREGKALDLVLGSYVLLDLLGQGATGRVYRARHTVLNRLMALKVIGPEVLRSPRAAERFQREVQAVTRLAHPNIVVAHEAGQIGESCYLAMEFVDGINLAALLNQAGPLPIPLACDLVRQAALALQHAHDHKLVHRDVKPSNLMLVRAPDRPPLVKVLDFGLARFLDGSEAQSRLTRIGGRVGTVDYIAPEQVVDARSAGPRSDVFSLGATLFSILTGEPLYPGKDVAERLDARLQREPRRLGAVRPNLPDGLDAVVAALLARDPAQRCPSAAAAAGALEPFCLAAVPRRSTPAAATPASAPSLPLPPLPPVEVSGCEATPLPCPLHEAERGRKAEELPFLASTSGFLLPSPLRGGVLSQLQRSSWRTLMIFGGACFALMTAVVALAYHYSKPGRLINASRVGSSRAESSKVESSREGSSRAERNMGEEDHVLSGVRNDKQEDLASGSVTELRAALVSGKDADRLAAIEALRRLGDRAAEAVPELQQALSDRQVEVRRQAAVFLGVLGAKTLPAVPALAKTLENDGSAGVRLASAEALAVLRYPTNEKALPALIRAIGADPDTGVRQRSIWALLDVPDLEKAGAVKPLEAMLESTELALRLVRYDAARMLARKQGPAVSNKAVEVLLQMVRDRKLKVYRSSVAGAGGITGEDARYMAVTPLVQASTSARLPAIREALEEAARDKEPRLRGEAAKALKGLR